MIEQTLCIIKPDAVEKKQIGNILNLIESADLNLVGANMLRLNNYEAERFYSIHKDKSFFKDLVKFMTSGPVFIGVLRGENAVKVYRETMGATDPSKADRGTIRKLFGESIQRNAVHGSDSLENAEKEIAFFFYKDCLI